MDEKVCLDANVLTRAFTPEPGRERATALLRRLALAGAEIVGPSFVLAEVLSSVRRKALQGLIAPEEETRAISDLLKLGVTEVSGPAVYRRAYELAALFGRSNICDTVYVAVAEAQQAVLFTADEGLHRQVHDLVPASAGLVRLL